MSTYRSICGGIDDEATIELNSGNINSSSGGPTTKSSSTENHNNEMNQINFICRYVLGALYFCNQRPGIFIAPFLLVKGWRESHIGVVLFISGIIGLVTQAPAGELTDETPYKRSIIWFSNFLTIIGCLCLLYSEGFSVIVFAVSATVISDAFSFPALYSITLGLIGPKGIAAQVPFNESLTHSGNAFFAIISGLVVAFTEGGLAIFWICIVMRLFSCIFLNFISKDHVNVKRARGLEHDDGAISAAPITYFELFSDYHVFIFLLSVFFFHFSNAAMLPLLSQKLFIDNNDLGFEFAALAVIIAQVSMIGSAMVAGELVKYYGTKLMFLTAIAFIPARGAIIVFLLTYFPNNIMLLTTQILDGFAGGAVGVLTVLIAENLSRGSGRFALLIGLARTGDAVGAAFSNLVGESIAEHSGYTNAFVFLSVAALIPLLVYGLFMPSSRYLSDGTAVDELSISQRSKYSRDGSSQHSKEGDGQTHPRDNGMESDSEGNQKKSSLASLSLSSSTSTDKGIIFSPINSNKI